MKTLIPVVAAAIVATMLHPAVAAIADHITTLASALP